MTLSHLSGPSETLRANAPMAEDDAPSLGKKSETTALVSESQMNEMRFLSGEGKAFFPSMALDYIAIDHETGHFYSSKPGTTEGEKIKIDMGPTFAGVILRIRRKLSCWISADEYYYTPEYDSPKDRVPLFNAEGGKIASMQARLLQTTKKFGKAGEKWLRVNNILYVLLADEIFKFTVRGASSKPLRHWLKYRGNQPLPSAETIFTLEGPIKSGSVSYYTVAFSSGEPVPPKSVPEILAKQRELNGFIAATQIEEEPPIPGENVIPIEEAFSTVNPVKYQPQLSHGVNPHRRQWAQIPPAIEAKLAAEEQENANNPLMKM